MKFSRLSHTVLRAGLLVAAISPVAHATTYTVDRGHALANDENPGTPTQPLRTISRAAALARAGDTVVVMSGMYPESVQVTNSGTPTQPISFTAKGKVVVSPTSQDNWTGVFNVLGKSDISISGFTVQNAYYGLKVAADRAGTPPTRITLKNNYASMTRSSGINVNSGRDITVDSNVVEKTNYGGVHEMISIINTDGFLVKNNEVFNGKFVVNGVTKEGKEGIDIKEGSRNGRVLNNKVHDLARLGIYVDAWDLLTHTIEVSGNVVYNCKNGIAIASEQGGLVKDVLVSNNIAYNNMFNGIIVASWSLDGPRENIQIINNTVYGNAQGGIRIGTTNIFKLDIQNNISANNGGPAFSAVNAGLVSSSINNLSFGKNPGNILSGMLTGDPRFVGASSGNFQLSAGSAAANKGVAARRVPIDIVGRARPLGGAFDIGAFESN